MKASKLRKRTVATKVVINDTRKRIRELSKDLGSDELKFRLGLSRTNLSNLEERIAATKAELADANKLAGETRDTIIELESLLESRR